MKNESMEARIRKFLRYVGFDQIIHEESVKSTRALEILRGINMNSILESYCPQVLRHDRWLGTSDDDFRQFIEDPASYLVGIKEINYIGTYKQYLNDWDEDEIVVTHKLNLSNYAFFNKSKTLSEENFKYLRTENLYNGTYEQLLEHREGIIAYHLYSYTEAFFGFLVRDLIEEDFKYLRERGIVCPVEYDIEWLTKHETKKTS